ncbi:MAG: PBP1A family penicillin-binding protein [Minisyncoccota bacterium]
MNSILIMVRRALKRIRKQASRKRFWKTVSLFFAGTILFFVGAVVIVASMVQIPDFNSFNDRQVAESTKIYDRTGKVLLYDVHDSVRRTSVPLSQISPLLRNATIATEDDQFYSHEGVRITSILRAFFVDLFGGGYTQGGSTITQQVVKNTLLSTEKTITRKIKEIILAVKIEHVLSKDEILSIYLNETPYGGNMYGVEEASKTFFGKSANDLTLAESAYLASLPKAPTYYSPYGNHRDELKARKNFVLRRMLTLGFINQADYQSALAEKVIFIPQEQYGIKAPHFVQMVKEYLASKYGEDAVTRGGLEVTTTLDYSLQEKAEAVVSSYAASNEKKFNDHNIGMVGMDPKTGQVLLMVGSRNYFENSNNGSFNVTLSHRQPGSSFKPFVYATAFTKGYGPESVVFDLPTQFDTNCGTAGGNCYAPKNYDGKYLGPVSLRDALAQSINIPAVKMLYLAGVRSSIQTAERMGITSLTDPARYGLTLVLGGGEVSLFEMTGAYGVFANEGVRNPPAYILQVQDKNGTVLEKYTPHPEEVIDRNATLLVSDILSDNVARTPLYGDHSALYFDGRQVAVKTGTTNDYRDAWTLGYTPSFVLGAWAGNNNNSPMTKNISGLIITPIWHEVMAQAIKDQSVESFSPPLHGADPRMPPIVRGLWQGGESYSIDKQSGKLATDQTPENMREEHVVQNVHSELFWINKDNPFTKQTNPYNDPQFPLWEAPVRTWAAANGYADQSTASVPQQYDDVHTVQKSPQVVIDYPPNNAPLSLDQQIVVRAHSTGAYPLARTELYVNHTLLGTSSNTPPTFSFIPRDVDGIATTNTLEVVVYDTMGNKGGASIQFSLDSGTTSAQN